MLSAPTSQARVREALAELIGGKMSKTYRITDDAGFLIAEIRFHNRTHDDLVAVYLQDVCEVLGAAGYHPVTEEEA
jgi:5-deoxy-D-glucuronate isomerase